MTTPDDLRPMPEEMKPYYQDEPAPADVDPDEALALVAYNAFTGGRDDSIPLGLQADWRDAARAAREYLIGGDPAPADVDPDGALAIALRAAFEGRDKMSWAEVARTARECIEDSLKVYYRDLYDKAEADLARVTKERDGMEAARNASLENESNTYDRMIEWQERAIEAQAKADRYDALREDVEKEHAAADEWSLLSWSEAKLARILNRDDRRAES